MITPDEQNYYWLASLYLPLIGPVRLKKWVKKIGNIKNLFISAKTDLLHVGLNETEIQAIQNINWHEVDRDLNWCEKNNCHLLRCDAENYPTLLKQIVDAPVLLFVKGEVAALAEAQLAMVGTRNPTIHGKELAYQFASCLAQAGLIITSGLAMGIDAASHEGALHVKGKTIAVCGTGLQTIYPASNRKLVEKIILNGAVISEFLPQTPPRAMNFPQRNRIISGLSLGVLVVEAAQRSGSLITSRFALEQGREVFAIPGSIYNPLARGCHELIRQGAKLVETAQDILEELNTLTPIIHERSQENVILNEGNKNLLEKIGYEITPLDAIIRRSGLTPGKVSSMLLSLEIEGLVQNVSGGYVRIANKLK